MVNIDKWPDLGPNEKDNALLQLLVEVTDVLELHANLLDTLMQESKFAKLKPEVQTCQQPE